VGERERIGPFEVLAELGRGGMGVVYAVRRPDDPRRLVLKRLDRRAASPEGIARFVREARLLARVEHPGVVRVHDLAEAADGAPYLVCEHVPGEDLHAVAKAGPVAPRRAAEVVRDLCRAVEAVHAAGVLHRDIKPANAVLRPDGAPILLDFGLARAADGERLTTTGELVGTPNYMAPEQLAGGAAADERTDVYGLGATLFELLAGGPPFVGPMSQVLHAVARADPPWPRTGAPGLDAVLRRAMAKRSADRYPDVAAFRADLEAWLGGEGPAAARRRWPRVVGAALVLGAAAGVGVAGLAALAEAPRRDPGPSPAAAPTAPSPAETAPADAPAPPAWSARPRSPGQPVLGLDVEGDPARGLCAVVPTEGAVHVLVGGRRLGALPLDGSRWAGWRRLAVEATSVAAFGDDLLLGGPPERPLRLVTADGVRPIEGAAAVLGADASVESLAVGPDGAVALGSRGSSAVACATLDPARGCLDGLGTVTPHERAIVSALAFVPAGLAVAGGETGAATAAGDGRVWIVDPDAGEVLDLHRCSAPFVSVARSATERTVFLTAGRKGIFLYPPLDRTEDGFTVFPFDRVIDLALDPDGLWLYVAASVPGGGDRLRAGAVVPGEPIVLRGEGLPRSAPLRALAVSRDGRWLLALEGTTLEVWDAAAIRGEADGR